MTGLIGSIVGGPAAWALGAFGAVKRGVGSATHWAGENTTHMVAAAALVVIVPLGIHDWLGHRSAAKWHATADRNAQTLRTERLAYVAAQKEATARQMAANAAAEAHYSTLARNSDAEHQTALADAQRATDAFIRSHRLSAPVVRPAGGTTATAQGDDPGVPASLPAGTIVAVSAADVQACKDADTYAVDAYNWGQKLIAAGLAVAAAQPGTPDPNAAATEGLPPEGDGLKRAISKRPAARRAWH